MPSYTITVENNNSISDNENASKNTKLTKLNQNSKDSKKMLPFNLYKKKTKQNSKSSKQRPVSSINESQNSKFHKEMNRPRKDNEIVN
jgi:hypothetical protein